MTIGLLVNAAATAINAFKNQNANDDGKGSFLDQLKSAIKPQRTRKMVPQTDLPNWQGNATSVISPAALKKAFQNANAATPPNTPGRYA